MGVTRAPVDGSGAAPAWMASVANPGASFPDFGIRRLLTGSRFRATPEPIAAAESTMKCPRALGGRRLQERPARPAASTTISLIPAPCGCGILWAPRLARLPLERRFRWDDRGPRKSVTVRARAPGLGDRIGQAASIAAVAP